MGPVRGPRMIDAFMYTMIYMVNEVEYVLCVMLLSQTLSRS